MLRHIQGEKLFFGGIHSLQSVWPDLDSDGLILASTVA
jgi:hypothetical protein